MSHRHGSGILPMTASSVPFEVFDHPAEAGIVAYGRDLPELFANAARGMFHFIVDPATVQVRECRPRVVAADDLEGLLVAWLNDLLVVLNADEFLPREFLVEEVTSTRVQAGLAGEPVDPQRHRFRLDVKAATYHGLRLERGDGWSARVLFDV
ncbi:MAG: archease [Armatimonadota bacterium]|nr:archease [Armatimonadota bacterium]